MTSHCPYCGNTSHYGADDLATCAKCHRFIVPEPDTNAEGDAINAEAVAAHGTWRKPSTPVADTPLVVLIRRVTQQGGAWVNLRGDGQGVIQQGQEP